MFPGEWLGLWHAQLLFHFVFPLRLAPLNCRLSVCEPVHQAGKCDFKTQTFLGGLDKVSMHEDVSAVWGWTFRRGGGRQAGVPTLVCESDLYIPLCRWACPLYSSYVWHLTQYLHSSLCPLLSPLLCCLTGIDFKVKTIEVDGKKVKLQVWSVVTVAPSLCTRFRATFPALILLCWKINVHLQVSVMTHALVIFTWGLHLCHNPYCFAKLNYYVS